MINRNDLSDYEKNLITFLRLFQNRPFHLAKYFLENDCLSENFQNHLKNSKRLSKISQDIEISESPNIYFINFNEMVRFFDSLSLEINSNQDDDDKIYDELNSKLEDLIREEKYEEAIRIRDFMTRNNIKRKP